MPIAESLARVREHIATAAHQAGRNPGEVKLIAVTKTMPATLINEAISAGAAIIGENRVQEFHAKRADLLPSEVHLIGALQSNKAKMIVGQVALIHSLDRLSLAQAIQASAERLSIVQDVLIQVCIGDEDTKSGVDPAALPALAEALLIHPNIRPRGLMCIPPPATGAQARRHFAELRACLLDLHARGLLPPDATELSMGMSGDYEEAIQEGATMVRVGRSIFGERA